MASPYTRIDTALAEVTTLPGDTVLVAPGDYMDESIDYLGKDVIVESSAGATQTRIVGLGVGSTSHPLVEFNQGETGGAILRRFTLTAAPGGMDGAGSAIYVESASPRIEGCIFENNLSPEKGTATFVAGGNPVFVGCTFTGNAGEGAVYGRMADIEFVAGTFGASASSIWGGIVLEGGSLVCNGTLFEETGAGNGDTFAAQHFLGSNTTFTLNGCSFAGAASQGASGRSMYLDNCNGILDGCTFSDLRADALLGAAICAIDGDLVIKNSSFNDCEVVLGVGGAVALVGCRASFTDCNFRRNLADAQGRQGGAIYKWGPENLLMSNVLFLSNRAGEGGAVYTAFGPSVATNCIFLANTAEMITAGAGTARGGAMYLQDSATMVNNWFSGNFAKADAMGATADTALGGALYLGSSGNIIRCLFENNTASAHTLAQGGAVASAGAPLLNRCQFKRNRAQFPAVGGTGQGGAVSGPAVLLHASMIDNVAGTEGGAAFDSQLDHSICFANSPGSLAGTATAEYSLIEEGFAGTGNLMGDPNFWSNNDLNLLPGSPAIDSGNPANPTDPDGTILDMGALVFNQNHCGPGCEGQISVSPCNSNPNSTGFVGQTKVFGSTNVANNLIILTSNTLPIGLPGYYIASPASGFVPLFGGGQGNLCLGAPIYRFNDVVVRSNAAGQVSRILDLTTLPPPAMVLPGSTWHFQLWHRDFVGVTSTSNTTSSAMVMFQ